MTPSVRSSLLFAMTTTAALALSACGDHSSEAGKNAPANSASAAAASTAPAAAHTATAAPSAAASAPAPAASTAATPASEPMKLVDLAIGTSLNSAHKVAKSSEHFRPNDKVIYASVTASGKSEGGSLNAKWSYFGGSKPIVISNVSQTIPADTASITTFSLHNPNLWPEGRYGIVVELNGKPAAHASFQIRK